MAPYKHAQTWKQSSAHAYNGHVIQRGVWHFRHRIRRGAKGLPQTLSSEEIQEVKK
jgi:hypothetical protein